MSLTTRDGIFYAQLSVPPEVRHIIGKSNFRRSTGVRAGKANRIEAMATAAPWLKEWRRLIDLARQEPDTVANEIAVLKAKAAVERELGDFADERSGYTHADAALDKYEDQDWLEGLPPAQAKQYATLLWDRRGPPLVQFVERFVEARYEKKKTADDARRAIKDGARIWSGGATGTSRPMGLNEINRENARAWMRVEEAKQPAERRALKTMQKAVGFMSEYIFWLQDQRLLVDSVVNPYKGLRLPKTFKKAEGYLPVSLDEVLAVREAAAAKGDSELVAFIDIGRYTGMRIAEVGALSSESIETVDGIPCFRVKLDAKTQASRGRLVPIAEGLKRLLPLHNFDLRRRENAAGKRFGRLKEEIWVDGSKRTKCFHSIRKFVVTALEQNGVTEGVTADLVGHKKDTITYGVYSGGSALGDIAKAVAILDAVQPVGGDDPSNVVRLRG